MKLATWNVNSLAIRLPHLLAWLAEAQPDAVVLQETKLVDEKFPHAELKEAGWHVEFFGQKTYNGVALISKLPATDIVRNIPGHGDEQARVIAGTIGDVRIVGGYFPNGQAPGSDKFAYKMAWLDGAEGLAGHRAGGASEAGADGRLQHRARRPRRARPGAVGRPDPLHADEERAHFQALCGLGLHDAFRLLEQPPKQWSWWDYRNLAFRKNQGLRIDHILVSEPLRAGVRACTIDKAQRKLERPSDHAPVMVDIEPERQRTSAGVDAGPQRDDVAQDRQRDAGHREAPSTGSSRARSTPPAPPPA